MLDINEPEDTKKKYLPLENMLYTQTEVSLKANSV